MKRFFKRLGYGLDRVLTTLLFVIIPLVGAVVLFFEIHNLSGWFVILTFVVSIFSILMGFCCIYTIGTEIDEYKQLKNDKENKDNPELPKGGVDNGFFNNL